MKTCIIPARIGSKRIPKKNIKLFSGKPIITYPIKAAIDSNIFDKVIVYSDSDEIKGIARDAGAECFDRDDVSDTETTTEMLQGFITKFNQPIKEICILYPTAVFITPEIIKKRNLYGSDFDTIMTVCKYAHPIQRAFECKYGVIKMVNPEFMFSRTQDLPERFHDAGQMYFLNVESFKAQNKIFMERNHPILIDAIDIDKFDDWGEAERYYRLKINE